MDSTLNISTLERFQLIELVVFWEGKLTTKPLMERFDISRQQASAILNQYIKWAPANNLVYDKRLKGYIPSSSFNAVSCQCDFDQYAQLKAEQHFYSPIASSESALPIYYLGLDHKHLDVNVIRGLITAMRERKRVDVGYVSLNHPDTDGRVMVPHSFIRTPFRWHVRGYCEKNQDYRDFVLTRFRSPCEVMDISEHGPEDDDLWNTWSELQIRADARLTVEQQAVVCHDYGMVAGKRTIRIRNALIQYMVTALNIHPQAPLLRPEAQQIEIANWEDIQRFVP